MAVKMEFFSRKERHSENLGPQQKFPSPQTRRQVSATGINGSTEEMSQEKNDENSDLKCGLILCRNVDSEKGGHHMVGSL